MTAFFIIIFLCEAYVDFYVWKAQIKNASIREYDRLWHKWKFAMWTFIITMMFLVTGSFFLVASAAVTRLVVMQVIYNALRNQNINHLGTNAIDAFCSKYFGNTKTLVIKLILLLIIVTYEIFHFKTITAKVFVGLLSHN